MTKHWESSIEFKGRNYKKKRKRAISPEETQSKKQKIKVDDFFQTFGMLPDGNNTEWIKSAKPAYETSEETGNNWAYKTWISEESRNNVIQRKEQGKENSPVKMEVIPPKKYYQSRKGPERKW